MLKLLKKEFALFAHPTSWMFLAFGATLLLPVRKRDAVRARTLYFALTELLELAACVPFAILRHALKIGPNPAGMDVNLALFGLAPVVAGLFNALFLPRLYRNPTAVGKSFLVVSVWTFLVLFALEACCFVLPFFRDVLDTPDPQHLGAKLGVLALGAALFAALTLLGERRAERAFETVDL